LCIFKIGLENLLLFAISLELDYSDRTKGLSLWYGKAERWKKVAELYGTTKSSRVKKSAGTKDYRPPDTTSELLKNTVKKDKKSILPQNYQSYTHYRNSCYITALLEILYNSYLYKMDWWANNVGILQNNELGLKKLYTSFTIRDSMNNKTAKKNIYSSAREIIRLHVLEKRWQRDNEFGSLTLWFENIIKRDNHPLKILSHFCILGLRIWQCDSGHIRIAPLPFNPLTPINGIEDFDEPFFEVNPTLIGQVSALFWQKNRLISRINSDEPCQHLRASICMCDNRKIKYEEFIISWPSILNFEITQREDGDYNSSHNLDFPFQLHYSRDNYDLKYNMTGRAYSTSSDGVHYYSKVIRTFNEEKGIYIYDDLNNGVAKLESNDPAALTGNHLNTVLVSYLLDEAEDASVKYTENKKC
jgi:hypothetical protein